MIELAEYLESSEVAPMRIGEDYYDSDLEHAELKAACHYNECFEELRDVVGVVATLTGENDGPQWLWVVRTADGFAYARGGCDYTGWDCQSNLDWHRATSSKELVSLLADDERAALEEMMEAGVQEMKSPLGW